MARWPRRTRCRLMVFEAERTRERRYHDQEPDERSVHSIRLSRISFFCNISWRVHLRCVRTALCAEFCAEWARCSGHGRPQDGGPRFRESWPPSSERTGCELRHTTTEDFDCKTHKSRILDLVCFRVRQLWGSQPVHVQAVVFSVLSSAVALPENMPPSPSSPKKKGTDKEAVDLVQIDDSYVQVSRCAPGSLLLSCFCVALPP